MKLSDMVKILELFELKYRLFELDEKWKILIMERGGRIFGPFRSDCDEGLFWVSDVFKCEKSFKNFLGSDEWNIGGDRVWIAPEIQFSVTDRERFWETLKTPNQIDPGHYTMTIMNDKTELKQKMSLKANLIPNERIDLSIRRSIRRAPNPLRTLKNAVSLMEDVEFLGFEQLLELNRSGGDDTVTAECWSLLQVNPGYIYIPMFKVHRGVNYYEPTGEFEIPCSKGIKLCATGERRYKVGYQSAFTTGRIGYSTKFHGKCCLLIRNFPNNPSSIYAEEPPLMPGTNGFSIHVYNDSGDSGGFAELECNLQSVGLPAGYDAASDRVSTWIFIGNEMKLNEIADILLGMDSIEY